ncbi:hypothetical protein HK105_201045 [Polyrhizophydium stewartii]|uniref:ATP-dependent (S)-NAD(P)H-hydrate dehydratase n=1 Tax=Polyrhizophydium stewartii TaxID=2732419 RepID=A0ABR4NIP3_9FUNG|nr:hypothetical protein HK105_007630 [Polyrhizophydium stewartii]
MPLVVKLKRFVPPLSSSLHKGQAGRVGVVGGSFEYTGAPYYAAVSALRTGADLCHVFCAKDASVVIKSYSPELVVHPLMRTQQDFGGNKPSDADLERIVDQMGPTLARIDSLVVGPGLSRDPVMLATAARIIRRAISLKIHLVIDADGLVALERYPDVLKGSDNVVITPNYNEFRRLCETFGIDYEGDLDMLARRMSRQLGNVTVLHKGEADVVALGDRMMLCTRQGSPRRCGGQGDVLAGVLGTFLAWTNGFKTGRWYECDSTNPQAPADAADLLPISAYLCAYGASRLVRECALAAYEKRKRSMVTSDVIEEIGPVFSRIFDGE